MTHYWRVIRSTDDRRERWTCFRRLVDFHHIRRHREPLGVLLVRSGVVS